MCLCTGAIVYKSIDANTNTAILAYVLALNTLANIAVLVFASKDLYTMVPVHKHIEKETVNVD